MNANQKKWLVAGLLTGIGAGLLLTSCQYKPVNAQPLRNFEIEKYLGKWYEIARIDHRFERNLEQTTAEYSLRKDGSVRVLNRGYNTVEKQWKQAAGKARFRGDKKVGALKVSFFGPFYSGYNVIAISGDYKYALVAGKNLDYLWILSRHPNIPEGVKADFLAKAKAVGYDVNRLIWVNQGT